MKNNISEDSFNKNKSLEDSFGLNKDGLLEYIKKEQRGLDLISLETDLKHKELEKINPLQEEVLKATFKSLLYTNITAESSIDNYGLKNMQKQEETPELFAKRVYSWLASSGYFALEKQELAYMSELLKQEIINDRKVWLEKNNMKVEDVNITRNFRDNYVYHVVLSDLNDNMSGSSHGLSIDTAIEGSLKEVRRRQEQIKKWESELRKKDPEFMYIRDEYVEIFKKIGFDIYARNCDKENNQYSLSLSQKKHLKEDVRVNGNSWQDVFEKALIQAKIFMKTNEENDSYLNVTSFSNQEIMELFNSQEFSNKDAYFRILQKRLEQCFAKNKPVSLSYNEIVAIKNLCIKNENYELAAKITSYLDKNKNLG